MAWVVDSSVMLDVRIGIPLERAIAAARCLEQFAADGLVICPVSFIELAPAFRGDVAAQRSWLDALGISSREPWLEDDTDRAHFLWSDFIRRKREGQARKRPLADVLIAAFAHRFRGVITGNASDFQSIDPGLTLAVPVNG